MNEGKCNDDIDQYMCECLDGFQGSHCQFDMTEYAMSPCGFNHSCVANATINNDRCNSTLCILEISDLEIMGTFSCSCQKEVRDSVCVINPRKLKHFSFLFMNIFLPYTCTYNIRRKNSN